MFPSRPPFSDSSFDKGGAHTTQELESLALVRKHITGEVVQQVLGLTYFTARSKTNCNTSFCVHILQTLPLLTPRDLPMFKQLRTPWSKRKQGSAAQDLPESPRGRYPDVLPPAYGEHGVTHGGSPWTFGIAFLRCWSPYAKKLRDGTEEFKLWWLHLFCIYGTMIVQIFPLFSSSNSSAWSFVSGGMTVGSVRRDFNVGSLQACPIEVTSSQE